MRSNLDRLTRRDFLNVAAMGAAGLALPGRLYSLPAVGLPDFPQGDLLGRVLGGKVEVKARPHDDSPTVKELFEDSIVVWLREVVGSRKLWVTQRYIETSEGYIYAPNLQPVRNKPNAAVSTLPNADGMWVEVTVPYVDLVLANPPGRSPWLEYTTTPRLYYSQILWVDQVKTDEAGQILYRLSDRYGSFGDFFWAAAEAFRPLQADDHSPIHPEIEDKLVVVDLTYQGLSCMEGNDEVYYCRVSTGPKLSAK